MVDEADIANIGTPDDNQGNYYEGDDDKFAFPTTDGSGNELDLSSFYELKWYFKRNEEDEERIVSYSYTNDEISIDNRDGELDKQSRAVVEIDGDDTKDMGGFTYYHWLKLYPSSNSNGSVSSHGKFYISQR